MIFCLVADTIISHCLCFVTALSKNSMFRFNWIFRTGRLGTLGKWSKLLHSNRTHQTTKIDGGVCLHPPCLTSKDGVFIAQPPLYPAVKKLQWDSNLAFLVCLVMLTLDSWIFLCQLKFKSQSNFVGNVHEIDGVFDNPPPPYPKQCSSIVVLTSSLNLNERSI